MAPALTEPISPKEKLTSSGTATASPTSTRASRKIDSENFKGNNNNNNNNNNTLKQSPPPTLREKRNCNNNNIPVVQVPTTSSIRLTRSRDFQQRLLSSPKCKDQQQQQQQSITPRKASTPTKSTTTILKSTNDPTNNEQMGLSTAVLDTKNQIINNQNTSTAAELTAEDQNTTPAAAGVVEKEVAPNEDTSTAQLLADLTNEAITADICLRNQLKDVNLVKVAEEGSASPLQRDSDIVVIKSITASPSTTITTTTPLEDTAPPHMDKQCNSAEEDANTKTTTSTIKGNNTSQTLESEADEPSPSNDATNHVVTTTTIEKDATTQPEEVNKDSNVDDNQESNVIQHNECPAAAASDDIHMEICDVQESSPPGSPDSSEEENKKDINSKAEIISVQELPPVNTDSTMTASEVEDNLEERLSQLDGTAIDSPPPNNDVDDEKDDVVMKSAQLAVESSHTTTPPRTPTHQQQQQSLAQDIQDIQQQLQHTPPTPISQQVQAHHMQQQQQHPLPSTPQHHQQLQQQQQNCLTPQSTASSVNTVGSGNIPASFIKEAEGGAAELEDQDIEEVFKVLKNFEGGTTSDLNVCDLNVLFNEVYMKMNESEMSGTVSGGVPVAGGSSGSVSQGHVTSSISTNPSIQLVKPTELEEAQKDIEERQRQMQRRVDILMRRLRKLQARYMCKHTSEEIAGLFELSSRQSNKVGSAVTNHHVENTNPAGSTEPTSEDIAKYFQKITASRPPASDWKSEQEELVPAKQISMLLRKIETVANAQQHCLTPVTAANPIPNTFHNIAPTKKTKKALLEAQQNAAVAAATVANNFKNDTTLNPSATEGRNPEDIIVATLYENVTTELTQVAGLLQSEMYEVQRAIDSDATESSSGGESADEMVVYNNQQQQTLPIRKRAAWRYSRDRAAIASRWSWLLSQIADLEIKIRQHSELYQEIVKTKGPVISSQENGLKIDRHDVNMAADTTEDLLEGSSCRTRGFNPSQFRKRKLIQTTNIHTISKKAARPSTIKCGCQWPIHPCALCTGRVDPTAPRDLPDTMMMSERIALLDAGYHPVLSFRENVNNALHFEAIAKQPEWQQRVMRCQAKHIAKSVWKAEREAVAGKKIVDGSGAPMKRRYVKKKDREDKNNTTTQQARESATKSGKKQACQILSDVILKEPYNSNQPSPLRLSNNTAAGVTTAAAASTMNSIHQTSDYHPTISYDQYNLNQTHSSSISNSSKSNKNRKLSSASIAATSHHYNQHHNNYHLYNGDSSFMHNYDWSAAGGVDSITARSRTSSPTHGVTSYHNKSKGSFDRKNRVSYDIDNIVIPYSVAAATRVEILPYKEIPTPKWRIVNTAPSDKTANLEPLESANLNITSNGNAVVIKCNGETPNNLMSSETKALSPSSTDIKDHKISSDKNKTNNTITKQIPTTANDVADVADKGSKCIENGDVAATNLNNENCEIKEPLEKKPKIEPNVIKIQIKPPASTSTSNTSAALSSSSSAKDKEDIATAAEDDEYCEDISDEAMILRHERALTEERRKFQTFLKFPWSTRSRANRRIDSRAESSGANTPDPSSPAPQTPSVGGGDQDSIPSPSTPSTPLNILDTISEAGDNSTSFLGVGFMPSHSSKRQERRRTTSAKRDFERRSSTPDSKELIPPYEPMKFPLTDEQFEELQSAMPSEHNEESKRFDDCYLPGGTRTRYCSGPPVPANSSKRSSRSSTMCGGERRTKGSLKPASSIDDATENNCTDLHQDYEEYDDYPKHHLATNDDHLTADDCDDPGGIINDDMYGDDDYVYGHKQNKRRNDGGDSDGDSTETEPFQDDDPNDPEWRGETEDRTRKKAL
ncbi:non-specific lethal 1 isoform X2 [Musca autumnalis]|uniref:non-specific lethal 1 isoform X2 n=1 Tax=Musca autumnalis TaxID=221902 RepID=UPI003CF0B538